MRRPTTTERLAQGTHSKGSEAIWRRISQRVSNCRPAQSIGELSDAGDRPNHVLVFDESKNNEQVLQQVLPGMRESLRMCPSASLAGRECERAEFRFRTGHKQL